MNWLKQHPTAVGHLLCLLIILFAAWPVLQQPRLEADDYRYLHHIQQWKGGELSALEAMTVENRWDHLWFMQEEGRIRFFRPTVVLSYGMDQMIWGRAYALGLTVTNVLIHFLCAVLVGLLFRRLIGAGWVSVLGAGLFAGLTAHAECIWYIAGRTDSLAALGLLGALVLHLNGRRWWALPLFAFGLLTKELVIVGPVIFAAYDWWIARRKIEWKLYGAYAVLAVLLLAIKKAALGGEGSDFVYPYLISPLSAEFPQHLWLQFRSYAGNLLAAEVTVPFADAATVQQLHPIRVPMVGSLVFGIIGWFLRNDRRAWLLLLLGLLAWLPTSFVYLSERYLYLPSIAFVGLLTLFAATRSRGWKWAGSAGLAVFLIFQTLELRERQSLIVQQSGSVQEMLTQLEPVRDQIQPDQPLLLVNAPGLFVRAQFMQDILRVFWNAPELQVEVLTMMPGQNGTEYRPGDAYPVMGAGVQVELAGDSVLLRGGVYPGTGQPPHRIMEYGMKKFDWLPLESGSTASNSVFTAGVLSGDGRGATAIRYTFFQPLENPRLVVWKADGSDLNAHPWQRRKNATVELR
ncbi:hypothetical protein P4B35_16140 [Pontiellaceae bacterium B12227]|nr:hypothetical protein [Pontiellaceae bacterium B12227]